MPAMIAGFRECPECGKELPEECFRGNASRCGVCQREAEERNPAVKIAAGIIDAPRERWAKELLARLR